MAKKKELLHDRNRLAIVSLLVSSTSGNLPFTFIQEKTRLTAGNLSSHLRTMEEAQLVIINKQFKGRRPFTTVEVTAAGRLAFHEIILEMEEFVKQFRSQQENK